MHVSFEIRNIRSVGGVVAADVLQIVSGIAHSPRLSGPNLRLAYSQVIMYEGRADPRAGSGGECPGAGGAAGNR